MLACLILLASALSSQLVQGQEESKNEIIGDPVITCGDSYIGLTVTTSQRFQGNLFVTDKFVDPECRVRGNGSTSGAEIRLPFESCGLERRRSSSPRGVFVSTMLVLSFNSQFITKEDKAYMLQCFYMEMDMLKMVEIGVAMLTTSFQTQVVPMPICRYEVLAGGPSGPPVRYAQIGDKVYHKWTCDSETLDTFCILVHSCTVNDGGNDVVDLLDDEGCSLDPHLLDNLDYLTDLMAGKEAHVFKYADRDRLFFDCQIAISVKEPGEGCPRPLTCPAPSARRRGKRSLRAGTEALALKEPAELVCMDSVGVAIYAAANAALLFFSILLVGGAVREAKLAAAQPLPSQPPSLLLHHLNPLTHTPYF